MDLKKVKCWQTLIREKFIPEQISQFGFVVFTIVISIFAALNPYIEFKKAP